MKEGLPMYVHAHVPPTHGVQSCIYTPHMRTHAKTSKNEKSQICLRIDSLNCDVCSCVYVYGVFVSFCFLFHGCLGEDITIEIV